VRGFDDADQVRFHGRHRYTAQAVVGADGHDQDAHVATQRLRQPPDGTGRGVA
jgi:hypothetical protein